MNTHLANISSLSGLAGTNQSGETKAHGLLQAVSAFFARIADMPRRSREAAELSHFSDRELADVGLNRSDLDRISTPEFAADYHQGRHSAMFLIRS
jgi:uncharacterized protein YjiS (DUF1127 family)